MRWTAVEDHPAGGDLRASAGTSDVHYRLSPDHRAYVFQGKLGDGVSEGTNYLALPQAPLARTLSLPAENWESVRVYDQGACSALLTWDTILTQLLVAAIPPIRFNLPGGADNLRHTGSNITPTLRSTPRSALSPLGLTNPTDAFALDTEFRMNIGVCGETAIQVHIDVEPRLREGFNTTPASDALDAELDGLGCVANFNEWVYNCRLMTFNPTTGELFAAGALDGSTSVNTFAIHPDDSHYSQAQLDAVGCEIEHDRYVCIQPVGDNLITGFNRETYRRPVAPVANSKDISLHVSNIDVDIDDCWPGELLFEDNVERQIRNALDSLDDQIGQLLPALLGDSAMGDHGIPFADLPPCITDWSCRQRSFRGGQRHSCTSVVDAATFSIVRRCDDFRIEPRRLHLRPEGIEVVLAESPGDPQFSLLDGRFIFGVGRVCRSSRYDSSDTGGDTYNAHVLPAQHANASLVQRVCELDEYGCANICPNAGLACSDSALFGGGPLPAGSRCQAGLCCPSSWVCNGLFCHDLMRDFNNCGVCGNACSAGEVCIAGICR